jgi:N-acetylneuraminate synthase
MAIEIADKKIGDNAPCFIIAEVGINHNNDLEIAKKLIDSAADARCDAVKFQAFKASKMYPVSAGKLEWKDKEKKYSYDIFKSNKLYEIPNNWWPKLYKHAKSKNLVFFASVCDENSADEFSKYIEIFKTTSFAITHLPLLKHIAKKGKPIMFSTGTSTMPEIKEAYDAVKALNKDIMILHCISEYPAPAKSTNLVTINLLKEKFPDAVIGFSDHSEDIDKVPVSAVVYGTKIIEKHITLDRKMKGPDHFFALEPEMLKKMVANIRKAEKDIEDGKKILIDPVLIGKKARSLTESEKYLRKFARRSVMTKKALKKGHILQKDDIIVLRNGKKEQGLAPKWYDIISDGSYMLTKDVEKEHPIKEKDIKEIDK